MPLSMIVSWTTVDLVVEHPQIDVVERERQRHSHPMRSGLA